MSITRDNPSKLYHYTSLENAIRYILPECRLKMNELCKMNDPKENLLHIVESNFNFESTNNRFNIFDLLGAQFIREKFRCLCFSTDSDCKNSNRYGYALQKMWAQYGHENTGICLVIDYQRFIKENVKLMHDYSIVDDFVSYNNDFNVPISNVPKVGRKRDSNKVDSLNVEEHLMNAFNNKRILFEYFFTKSADWEGEAEYRFLSLDWDKTIYLSIADSLDKVIKGLNFPEDMSKDLEQLIENDKVDKIDYYPWRNEFRLLSKGCSK